MRDFGLRARAAECVFSDVREDSVRAQESSEKRSSEIEEAADEEGLGTNLELSSSSEMMSWGGECDRGSTGVVSPGDSAGDELGV